MLTTAMGATAAVTSELPVQGMSCAGCVRRIESTLREWPGVREVHVNLVTARASVVHDAAASAESLARVIEGLGFKVPRDAAVQVEAVDEEATLGRAFALAAALTGPLLVIAMSHGAIPGTDGVVGRWLQFVLATVVVFGPGRRFLRLAWAALKHRAADMNTLVSLGVLAAWGWSTAALVVPGVSHHLYFEAAAAIVTLVLLGRRLEARARGRLADAVRGLAALTPKVVRRVRGDVEEDVDIAAIVRGDRVRVRPGERVPADGEVVQGASAVDESMWTGESLPVDKVVGSTVLGGTLNHSGALIIKVTRTGGATALAQIAAAVEQAQGSRAPIARLADVVSGWFVPVVLAAALLALVAWTLVDPSTGGLAIAVERFVAVLVIACPCALGLATPAAVAVGTGRGAELGVLIKGGAALEAASRVDTVLLDKTGTLTTGAPVLTEVVARGMSEEELLRLVAAAERASEHPVARAIVRGADERGVAAVSADVFKMEPGRGVEAEVAGRAVRVGTGAWLGEVGVDVAVLSGEADALAGRGHTPVFVAVDGALAGLIAVADRPVEGAREVVAALRGLGIEVAMVTGDREGAARAIAEELGIPRVIAEVRPADKARAVAEERARGRVVAMVGDGINDAPALAGAHVGVAIGGGTDIAAAAADVVLLRGGITSLPTALRLARRTLATIRQNLFWAFVYNVVAVPVAAGALAPVTGWTLSPVLASATMSLSSVSVLLNSLRLRRFK